MPSRRVPPMIDPLRAAASLLTSVPVGSPAVATTGASAFPVVGAALGLVAAVPLLVLPTRDGPIAAILALAILAGLDGALHLDGLADTADALAAPDPASAERARTDPRVGAFGAVALVLVLAVDATCLALLVSADRGLAALAVIAGAAAGRGAVATVAPWLPLRESGLGAWFGAGTTRTGAGLALVGLIIVAMTVSIVGRTAVPALAAAAGAAVSWGALVVLARRQDGATGDAFGAAVELGFAASLCAAALLRP